VKYLVLFSSHPPQLQHLAQPRTSHPHCINAAVQFEININGNGERTSARPLFYPQRSIYKCVLRWPGKPKDSETSLQFLNIYNLNMMYRKRLRLASNIPFIANLSAVSPIRPSSLLVVVEVKVIGVIYGPYGEDVT
jgi:hypothetical protein